MADIVFNGEPFTPGKIVCIGRNYVEHIEELGNEFPENMVVFNKPASAISETLFSNIGEPLHYEAELCFLIRQGSIAGVGFGLDLTKRELQTQLKEKGLPWERAKAFDGAATFSSFVTVPEAIEKLSFMLHIDGQLVQQGDPALMLYPPAQILSNLADYTSLDDNDIIMTGTPKGVGKVLKDSQYTGRVYFDHTLLIEHTWIGH